MKFKHRDGDVRRKTREEKTKRYAVEKTGKQISNAQTHWKRRYRGKEISRHDGSRVNYKQRDGGMRQEPHGEKRHRDKLLRKQESRSPNASVRGTTRQRDIEKMMVQELL